MYHSFSIKNFRCFDDLTLDGLGRINLIGGKNNIGKSALLEALWVHSGPTDPERLLRLDTVRGLGPTNAENSIDNLFFSFDSGAIIDLCALGDWGVAPRQLEISALENPLARHTLDSVDAERSDVQNTTPKKQIVMNCYDEVGDNCTSRGWFIENPNTPGSWTIASQREHSQPSLPKSAFLLTRRHPGRNPDTGRYSELERIGQQDGVSQILQILEPKLQRLTILATGTEPRIYADVGTKPLIPVELMGEGMSRILSVALAIASSPGGMVLVDEIENGLHYTVMEKVWQAIAAFARSYEVQIFATTHSHHCIQSACRAFAADAEELLQLYSLGYRKGKISAARYDRERLEFAFEVGLGVI